MSKHPSNHSAKNYTKHFKFNLSVLILSNQFKPQNLKTFHQYFSDSVTNQPEYRPLKLREVEK